MDLDLVPILADSIKGYYEDNELVELCDLYDIDLDFDGGKPAYMRLARDLISEISDPLNSRFLKAIIQSLLNRAREGAAKTKWDRQEYHRTMVDNLEKIQGQFERINSVLNESETSDQILATAEEVASLLRTDVKTVETILESGELDGFKIGNEWKIRTESIIDFLKNRITDQRMQSLRNNLQKPEAWGRELRQFPELMEEIYETNYDEGSFGAFLKGIIDDDEPKEDEKKEAEMEISSSKKRDVFICHAGEDKKKIVEPLVSTLEKERISYWYAQAEINWGDSLTQKINQGLGISRFVIVVLTKNFISKRWPRRELDSALSTEVTNGAVKVLPLLSGTEEERKEIFKELPLLNDKFYIIWENGVKHFIDQLKRRLKSIIN